MIKKITALVCMVAMIVLGSMNVSAMGIEVLDYYGYNDYAEYNEHNNVGNGLEYTYKVTELEGNEIHGIALDRISKDNAGIFLYADELSFKVNVGDSIVIVWGNEEDEFISIELVE